MPPGMSISVTCMLPLIVLMKMLVFVGATWDMNRGSLNGVSSIRECGNKRPLDERLIGRSVYS